MNVSMNDDKPLRTDVIDGQHFAIFIDKAGVFWAKHDEDIVKGDTLKAVHEALRRRVRVSSVRLALPVSLIQGTGNDSSWSRRDRDPNVEDATITGIHAGNKNVLVKRADGKTEQVSGSDSDGGLIVNRLTAAQRTEFLRLANARREAIKAMDAFVARVSFGGRRGIVEFVEAAVAKHAKSA